MSATSRPAVRWIRRIAVTSAATTAVFAGTIPSVAHAESIDNIYVAPEEDVDQKAPEWCAMPEADGTTYANHEIIGQEDVILDGSFPYTKVTVRCY